ncbi:12668_t:CDS:1, partial [Funneliformis mosseae]
MIFEKTFVKYFDYKKDDNKLKRVFDDTDIKEINNLLHQSYEVFIAIVDEKTRKKEYYVCEGRDWTELEIKCNRKNLPGMNYNHKLKIVFKVVSYDGLSLHRPRLETLRMTDNKSCAGGISVINESLNKSFDIINHYFGDIEKPFPNNLKRSRCDKLPMFTSCELDFNTSKK